MDYSLFNLSALLLGLAAWGLPLLACVLAKQYTRAALIVIWVGLACATLSLLSCTVYNTHLVAIGDWSAIEDTANAFEFVSMVMTGVALVLSAMAGVQVHRASKRNASSQKGA